VPSIEPPGHLSEQCRPLNSHGEKARRFTSNSPSTRPLWRSTTAISSFPPTKQLRREAKLFSGATLWIIPHHRHCRELRGCTLKNCAPKTPNRVAPVAPLFRPFLHTATAKLPSIPPSIHCHLVTVPLHLRHTSTTDFPHYPSQQPTSPLMSNRTHNMLRICPPFSQSNSSAKKNSERKTESEVHSTCQTRPKPSSPCRQYYLFSGTSYFPQRKPRRG